ncbi:hypothetical protein Nmel_012205 [Mimus melanotis]
MAGLHVRSLLVTGANRGIGLGLVQHFLRMPKPPQWIFAGCRDPKGQRAQELQNLASKHPNIIIIPLGRCPELGILCSTSSLGTPREPRAGRELCQRAGACRAIGHCHLWGNRGDSIMGTQALTSPVSALQNIKAAAAKVGEHLGGSGMNLLINNAGILKGSTLDTETLEDMSEVYTTNTIAPLLMGQAFLPLLKKAAQGSPGSGLSCSKAAIVNISSIGGSITSSFGWDIMQVTSYRCSKVPSHLCFPCKGVVPLQPPFPSHHHPLPVSPQAALNMLSKCQSLAYKEHGILCVALHPGWVQTDMGSSAGHTPPVTVDDSVQGMLKVLSSLSEKETGTFLDWEGKVIPW